MKCPSCGAKFKNGTTTCPSCRRYCGRTFESRSEDIFLTENRNPANGGYTQQQQNVSIQYTTTNENSDINPYGDMFFSTTRNEMAETNTQPDEFIPYDSNANPYDEAMEEDRISYENIQNDPHSTVYTASNVLEFREHMFGRELARKLKHSFNALIVISIISLLAAIRFDQTYLTIPFVILNAAVMIPLSLKAKKTYSKSLSLKIVAYSMIYSITIFVFSEIFNNSTVCAINEISLRVLYIALCTGAALMISAFRLFSQITKYYETWESYRETHLVDK